MTTITEDNIALSPEAFEQAIMAKGQYYHIHHPFHIMMHEGMSLIHI